MVEGISRPPGEAGLEAAAWVASPRAVAVPQVAAEDAAAVESGEVAVIAAGGLSEVADLYASAALLSQHCVR